MAKEEKAPEEKVIKTADDFLVSVGFDIEHTTSLTYIVWHPERQAEDMQNKKKHPSVVVCVYEGWIQIESNLPRKDASGPNTYEGYKMQCRSQFPPPDAKFENLAGIGLLVTGKNLADLMRVVPGATIAIVYLGKLPSAPGRNPMKDCRIQILGDRSEFVAERALAPMVTRIFSESEAEDAAAFPPSDVKGALPARQ